MKLGILLDICEVGDMAVAMMDEISKLARGATWSRSEVLAP